MVMINIDSRLRKVTFRGIISIFVLVSVIAILVVPGKAQKVVNTDDSGIAIKGYDPVAYFRKGKAVKGNPEIEVAYKGARWFFSSAVHRDSFKDSPEHYIPQYGGF